MQILEVGVAGTMESSDIMVRIEPKDTEGIELTLESSVGQQYGPQIRRVILETLRSLGVTKAKVDAVDKGALDCAIEARVSVAAFRAARRDDYQWKTKGAEA
ncbi:MAG: Citrate lyase acyl carrier protein [Firmicutes bacterium ADurb.Bin182]|nr:MAG: Citrate lyase acyl carrier protein [Firmicutes bacterium ADurb.Bin182]